MRTFVSYFESGSVGSSLAFDNYCKALIVFISILCLSPNLSSQIKVGDNPQNIDDGSLLELESISKALVVPRMTSAQRDNIPTPLKGAVIFNLTENCLQTNVGTPAIPNWVCSNSSGGDLGSITNTVLGHRIGTYINANGIPMDFHESITTLQDNGDGTFTYMNEAGDEVTINSSDETITTMIQNSDGSYTYINEDGISTVLDINETITNLIDNGDGTYTYTNENGQSVSFDTNETVTTLIDNNDGTYTYKNEEGILTMINPLETTSTLVDNGNGTYTYKDEQGIETTIGSTQITTRIENTINGHRIAQYTNEEGYVVDINETVTSLSDNGDGTFIYINEEGIGEDKTICQGETVELTVEGAYDQLLWDDGTSDNPKIVIPNQTTTYSVVATYQDCESSDEVTVNVNSILDLDLGPDKNICLGEKTTLSTSIGGNYFWSNGERTSSITVSPMQTTEYSLTITSANCSAEDTIIINVDDSFVDIIGSNIFCEGEEVTIEAIGSGGTYQWSTGAETTSITLIPFENISYRVTLTSPNGCEVEDEIVFTKFDNGDISLGPNISICEGSSVDLMLEGDFDNVIWDDNNSTNPSRTVIPTETTTYSITAQYGDCLSFSEVTIFVLQSIEIDLGSDITICDGLSVELGDSNTGGNYNWSTGETSSTINVSPSQTTTYSVTVTSDACIDTDEITVVIDNTCNVNLFVEKTVSDFNPKAGDMIEFTILIGNSGSVTATNIEVFEEIRSGFNYISSEATSGDYNENTSLWSINELRPNTTEILTINVEVLQNGDHKNIAEIISVDQDEDDPSDDKVDIDIEVDVDIENPDNTSEIGDYLWWDKNGNGIQGENEPGFEGLKVELFSTSNRVVPIAEQETNLTGYFCFTGLSSGEYFLRYEIPANHVVTQPDFVNTDNQSFEDKDSDITGKFGPGTTDIVVLAKNEQNKNVDGGLYPGGSIGDLVWKDVEPGKDNSYEENTDVGLENVTLELYHVVYINGQLVDTLLATTESDQNGNYQFGNLSKGDYILNVIEPEGESLGQSDLGYLSDIDNDFNPITKRTDTISLGASEIIDTVDAGFNPGTVPLTLVDFWGERIPEENFNRLFWITLSESNTDKFIIERSLGNTKNFSPIGEVEAAGNSSEELYYTFDDLDSRFAGQYYYRLKMLDLSGAIDYSKVVIIKVDDEESTEEEIEWKIFPVPTTDYLTIEIGLDTELEFKGFLVNNLGQHVRTFESKQLIRGKNLHTIDVIDLAQGQYYLNFYVGKEQFIAKVLVLD